MRLLVQKIIFCSKATFGCIFVKNIIKCFRKSREVKKKKKGREPPLIEQLLLLVAVKRSM